MTATTAEKPAIPTVDDAYRKELEAAAALLHKAKGWGLSAFAEKLGIHRRGSEVETLVDQTVRAAAIHILLNGQPYSFRSPNVFACGGGGTVDNGTAYASLVAGGWFVEAEVPVADVKKPPKDIRPKDDKYAVIYPSADLLTLVRIHCAK